MTDLSIYHNSIIGYSLTVGVGQTDPEHYGKSITSVGAENDATGLDNLISETTLYPKDNRCVLTNETATTSAFLNQLKKLQNNAESHTGETYIFIGFSGHGAKYNHHGKNYEFLCFYDKMLLEHELIAALHEFNSRTKLFLVLDACYSQGMTTLKRFERFKVDDIGVKTLREADLDSIFEVNGNAAYYEEKLTNLPHRGTVFSSEILFLSACEKDAVTYQAKSINHRSLFTDVLIACWKSGKFMGNYRSFYAELRRLLHQKNGPQLKGEWGDYFEHHRPFVFNEIENNWKTEIHVDKNDLYCTVHHPEFWFKPGSIQNGHYGYSELEDWRHPEYKEGDQLLICTLAHGDITKPSKSTTFKLNFKVDEESGKTTFLIPTNYLKGQEKACSAGLKLPFKLKKNNITH